VPPAERRLTVRRWFLAAAFVIAAPAYLLTNEAFQPIEERLRLEGRDATATFTLVSPESLYFEFEFVVRAPGGERAGVVLSLNDTRIAAIPANAFYLTQRAAVLVPIDAVAQGDNRLRVMVDGPSEATFEVSLRVHNYFGINPRFPRAFVVSDDAVADALAGRSPGRLALRFGTFYLVSLIVVWAIAAAWGRHSGSGAHALLVSPSFALWVVAIYGLATPLHVWLPVESVLVMGLVPLLVTAGVLWIPAHRGIAARLAAVTLVTLVACEAALRGVNAFIHSPVFHSDSYSRYRGRPGAPHLDAHLNSRGFNDDEHATPRPPHVAYRVAAIGDSVAFGVVPRTANYLTLLEKSLSPGGAVEVINMGVAGTEPRDYLSILVREGLAFAPNLVMVGFFIGNDFESARRKPYEYSYVATLAYSLWRIWDAEALDLVRADTGAGSYDDDQPTFSRNRFLEIAVDRAKIYRADDAGLRAPLTRAAALLRDMRDVSKRAGADFLVVMIPDEVQVDTALQDDVLRALGSSRDQVDFRIPNRLLARELTADGISFVDLLPVFESEARQARLYKPQDTHWNLAGNRVAATAIAPALRERIPR